MNFEQLQLFLAFSEMIFKVRFLVGMLWVLSSYILVRSREGVGEELVLTSDTAMSKKIKDIRRQSKRAWSNQG